LDLSSEKLVSRLAFKFFTCTDLHFGSQSQSPRREGGGGGGGGGDQASRYGSTRRDSGGFDQVRRGASGFDMDTASVDSSALMDSFNQSQSGGN
jgi:hypothetical protein